MDADEASVAVLWSVAAMDIGVFVNPLAGYALLLFPVYLIIASVIRRISH